MAEFPPCCSRFISAKGEPITSSWREPRIIINFKQSICFVLTILGGVAEGPTPSRWLRRAAGMSNAPLRRLAGECLGMRGRGRARGELVAAAWFGDRRGPRRLLTAEKDPVRLC